MTDARPTRDLTRLLQSMAQGDASARKEIIDCVYTELLQIARERMASERKGHTLQATDLVHEAYLRLLGSPETVRTFANRRELFHAAAEAMRRVLIDHGRRRNRQKRGGGKRAILDVLDLAEEQDAEHIQALDEAITRLTEWDARLGELVRLRFFTGLSVEETAGALGVSPRTVKRDWTFARAWLCRALGERGS